MRAPDFLIGGAPRSGTTLLCHALAQHPGIFLPEPYIPEPKVLLFDDESIGRRYDALFAAADPKQIKIEKTSYYLESEAALARVERYLPRAKMIFILREPVARAYSNYLRTRANGFESLDFADACENEDRRPSPFGPEKDYVRPFAYLSRGFYEVLVDRYYRALGRDRVHLLLYENLVEDWAGTIGALGGFLGLDLSGIRNPGRINANDSAETLDPGVEKKLRARMAPHVERLAALSGLDLSVWNYEAR